MPTWPSTASNSSALGAFDLSELSFHPGWTFHQAGANTSGRPRSMMTVIDIDAAMRLVPALNAPRADDRDQWFTAAREGEVTDTRKNPIICLRAERPGTLPGRLARP